MEWAKVFNWKTQVNRIHAHLVRSGVPLVHGGPYRLMRHPNYVGVAGELVGIALAAGARVSGPVMTLLFCGLMLKRIAVEERALGDAEPGRSGV